MITKPLIDPRRSISPVQMELLELLVSSRKMWNRPMDIDRTMIGSTRNGALRALITKGLVQRRHRENDGRRSFFYRATPAGRTVVASLHLWRQRFEVAS